MGYAADSVELTEEQKVLFARMCAIIDVQTDGLALLSIAQDLVSELLRRDGDSALREQTLGEISRFFLGIIKAPNLSGQYKMSRLKTFACATVKIMLDRRVQLAAEAPAMPPPGPRRRAGDQSPQPQ